MKNKTFIFVLLVLIVCTAAVFGEEKAVVKKDSKGVSIQSIRFNSKESIAKYDSGLFQEIAVKKQVETKVSTDTELVKNTEQISSIKSEITASVPKSDTKSFKSTGNMSENAKKVLSDYISKRYSSLNGKNINTKTLENLVDYIAAASKTFKVSPLLIAIVIEKESCYILQDNKNSGARGYMQVMPGTGYNTYKEYKKVFNEFGYYVGSNSETARLLSKDGGFNILAGTAYIKSLMEEKGNNIYSVLKAYNGGDNPKYYNSIVDSFVKLSTLYPIF